MEKIFVYIHDPHQTSLIIKKDLEITHSFRLKKRFDRFKHLSTAMTIFLDSRKLRGYDLYFFEGSTPACIAPAVKTCNNKLIVKGNDQVTFFMENRSLWKYYFTRVIKLEKYIDGVIAVSNMGENLTSRFEENQGNNFL